MAGEPGAGFHKRASAALTLRGKTLNPALSRAAGRLAQLVEHLVYTERVGGSSPSPPTTGQPGCYRRVPSLGRLALMGMRSGGRVVEGARLESEYTPKAYRGFESLPLRQLPVL